MSVNEDLAQAPELLTRKRSCGDPHDASKPKRQQNEIEPEETEAKFDTQHWKLSGEDTDADKEYIAKAAKLLQDGEVVGFPTETVYGLGGNAFSDESMKKIFIAKGRPSDNPLIVHIANVSQLDFVDVSPHQKRLADAFWPGPLSIVFDFAKQRLDGRQISKFCTAGLDTVAVRIPKHPVALAMLEKCGLPIAAPSANTSGKPSPTRAQHVLADLAGRIPAVLDGGATGVGVESTVVKVTTLPDAPGCKVIILRPGGVTLEQLESVVGKGNVTLDKGIVSLDEAPMAPGMKYRHYAPEAPVHLAHGGDEELYERAREQIENGQRVGVMITAENKYFTQLSDMDVQVACLGSRKNTREVAQRLFDCLRSFDAAACDVILCEVFSKDGVGAAVMNRLAKAAGAC